MNVSVTPGFFNPFDWFPRGAGGSWKLCRSLGGAFVVLVKGWRLPENTKKKIILVQSTSVCFARMFFFLRSSVWSLFLYSIDYFFTPKFGGGETGFTSTTIFQLGASTTVHPFKGSMRETPEPRKQVPMAQAAMGNTGHQNRPPRTLGHQNRMTAQFWCS